MRTLATANAARLLALILACVLISACVALPAGGLSPTPASTPAAIGVAPAYTAAPTETSEPVVPTPEEVTPPAAETPIPTTAAPPPEPSPVVDLPPTRVPQPTPVLTAGRTRGIPILMYHYIRVNPVPTDRIGFGLSIPPAEFEAQMAYLEAHGYRSVTLADVASGAAFEGPGRAVAITFDDGYADAYTQAFPILTRHGFHATFYIITQLIGRPRYMTWDEVRALAAAGNLIGSHTESHPDLTRLDVVSLYAQLAVSRQTLEAQLGQPVLDFCYPAGRFDPSVKTMVRQVGYRTATTEIPGLARRGNDLLALPRVRVFGGVTLDEFANLLVGVFPARPTRVPGSPTRAPAS